MAVSTSSPHDLDLVIDFVNTLDADERTDALETPGDLARWLIDRGLLDADVAAGIGAPDRRQALRLREALRARMLENNGAAPDEHAAAELDRVARRGDLGVHFAAGSVALRPGAGGVAGALARLLIPIVEASGDGSWQRVKACRAPDCQWAFYDRSRNRSGVWCEMAVCGNRAKVRAYRRRAPGG